MEFFSTDSKMSRNDIHHSFKMDTGSFQPHPPVVIFAGTRQDLFDKVAVSENAFITGKPDTLLEIQRYAHETG